MMMVNRRATYDIACLLLFLPTAEPMSFRTGLPTRRQRRMQVGGLRLDSFRVARQRGTYRRGEADEQAASDICLRSLRPHACTARRVDRARGHRVELHRLAAPGHLLVGNAAHAVQLTG